MFIVQNAQKFQRLFAKYWKAFNVSSEFEFVALCTFYQTAVQCLILQHACRVQCQSCCSTSTWLLLPQINRLHTSMTLQTAQEHEPTSGNSDRALTQNEMSELGLYMLFKVGSKEISINCSASRDVNPWGAFALSTKGFLIQLCFSMSSENYFSKWASKCEHITVFISHSSVFCRERLPDCEFFKYKKIFINRSVFHNCSFILKAVVLSRSCRRWVSFPWSEMFNWFNFAKISQRFANWVRKTSSSKVVANARFSSFQNMKISFLNSYTRKRTLPLESHLALQ